MEMIQTDNSLIAELGEVRQYDPRGELQNDHVSTDGGRTVVKRDKPLFNKLLAVPEGAELCKPRASTRRKTRVMPRQGSTRRSSSFTTPKKNCSGRWICTRRRTNWSN